MLLLPHYALAARKGGGDEPQILRKGSDKGGCRGCRRRGSRLSGNPAGLLVAGGGGCGSAHLLMKTNLN